MTSLRTSSFDSVFRQRSRPRPLLAMLSVALLSMSSLACSSDEDGGDLMLGGGGGSGPTGAAGGGSPGISLGGGPVIVGGFNGGGAANAGGSGGGDCNPAVIGLLRDFKSTHPNMQQTVASVKGIVAPDLGPDKKPVFAGDGLKTVTNAADFDQWYRDTPDVNMAYEHQIDFMPGADGRAVYDNSMFFPLDGRGFGNQNNRHNYHFTFELHMEFRYGGGEVFRFRGDDDLFVFINNKLALDLGGIHEALEGTVNLDAEAARLGITPGNVYPLDFFHAERRTTRSNFRVETNLVFTNCTPIIVR